MQDIKERARDFIVSEMRDALVKIKELQEREAKLVEALKFYANKENYKLAPGTPSITIGNCINPDKGQTAIATLKSLGLE